MSDERKAIILKENSSKSVANRDGAFTIMFVILCLVWLRNCLDAFKQSRLRLERERKA